MEIGDKIPEILGKDADGNIIKASDFAGKKLILYFYPKDIRRVVRPRHAVSEQVMML